MASKEIQEKINYLSRGTEQIITREDLAWKLEKSERENRSMIVKYGVDPTAPDIHLGHLVPIKKLKHFQDIGHEITFLIGDFTGRIGDPSGKSSGRKAMTEEEVLKNANTYKEQIFKVLDAEKTNIVYNSSWLKNMHLEETVKLLSKNSVNNLIKRKSFSKRFGKGETVSGHELIYPFLQAYDSVALNADIELGGTDQYFNLIFGRDLQPKYGQEPQVVITTPLLEGLDGNEKMSKSLGNTVGIDENPFDMYRKIMKLKDNLIIKYFTLLTDVDELEIGHLEMDMKQNRAHPKDVKKRLAKTITTYLHSEQKANEAEKEFEKVYRQGKLPENIRDVCVEYDNSNNGKLTPIQIIRLCDLASNNGEARSIVKQRGFSIDSAIIEDPKKEISLYNNMVVKVGKEKYVRLNYKKNES
ncbi:tyrosine--tRNA ligase [Candidatus Woesearchaeota archaeon]|nr:tyrosine--tRNA ligase [Candidatus Woesearchaeota archaeon]